jgi:hypothetical protein
MAPVAPHSPIGLMDAHRTTPDASYHVSGANVFTLLRRAMRVQVIKQP